MIDRSPAEASNSQGLAEPSAMMTSALLVALNSPAMVAAATTGIPLTLTACTGAANQAFEYILVPPYTAPQAVATLGKSACLDIADYATAKSSPITAWPCGLDVMVNEYWTIKGDTLPIVQPYTPFCFGIDGASAKGAALADCTSSAAQFKIMEESTHNGTIVHKASGLCVTATGPAPPPPPAPAPRPPRPKEHPVRAAAGACAAGPEARRRHSVRHLRSIRWYSLRRCPQHGPRPLLQP